MDSFVLAYNNTFLFFFFPWKDVLCTEGKGSILLGCPFPHGYQDVAQLLSLPLGTDVCPHPLLDELECPLVLGDLEQLLVLLHKCMCTKSHMHLVCSVRCPPAAAVPRLAHVLGHRGPC